MGLVERFSKLRSRWSRNYPPNLARLMLLAAPHYGVAAICSPNSPWSDSAPMADGSAHDRRLPVHAGLVP